MLPPRDNVVSPAPKWQAEATFLATPRPGRARNPSIWAITIFDSIPRPTPTNVKEVKMVKGKEIRKPKKAEPPKQNASNPSAKGAPPIPPKK